MPRKETPGEGLMDTPGSITDNTALVCAGCLELLEDQEGARVLLGSVRAVKTVHDRSGCFMRATTSYVWRRGPFDTVAVWRSRGYDLDPRGRGLAVLVYEDKIAL